MIHNREIIAKNLVKRYADHTAVDNVSFHVQASEIFSLLGLNGAGKSTMVKMLTTLAQPTAGTAWVGGYDVVQEPDKVRSVMGVALQEIGMDPLMTATETLTIQARLFGFDKRSARQRAQELLQLVKLEAVGDKRIGDYSGGMRRRLDLALAIVHYPAILVLDEPTTALDPVSRRDIWKEIKRMNEEEGMTILLITHHLEEADALAHRVGIIDQGRLVTVGEPNQLKRELGADLINLVFDDMSAAARAKHVLEAMSASVERIQVDGNTLRLYLKNAVQAVIKVANLLQEAEVAPLSLTVAHPSLEDVFLKATGGYFQEKASVATPH